MHQPLTLRGSGRILAVLAIITLPALAGSPAPGIKNFDKVDDHVYRGAQPTNEGFAYLAKIGVKTVLDLREDGQRARDEERTVTAAGMKYVHVPMSGLTPPSDAQTRQVLTLLEDASVGPVFVHCMRGADRTGAVIATYHMEHDHWEATKALADANSHGMSWMQFPRKSYIMSFVPKVVAADVTHVDAAAR
jgi:tyrosine-protein phosphatase SIW14